MINQNELRIGNLVNRTKSSRNDIIGHVQFDESDWYGIGECIDYLENYEPIPLTEDWLVKLGMIKKNFTDGMEEELRHPDIDEDGSIWYYWVKGLFNLEIQENGEIWFEVYSHYKHIEHVHQLQNLYFALTGEELTIKQND